MKKVLFTLIISLFCLNLYSQTEKQLFKESLMYSDANKYKDAERITKILINTFQNSEDMHIYWNNLGYFQSKQDNKKEALKSFTKAFQLNNQFDLALHNRANTYKYLKQYDKAIIDYNNVIKINKDNSEALFDLALLYGRIEDFANSKKCFEKYIELFPDNRIPADLNLIKVKREMGLYDEALSDLNKLIDSIPNNEILYNNRGDLYNSRADLLMNMKRYDEAFVDVEKSLEIDPEYVTAIIIKGEIYYFKGDYGNACIFFKIALSKGAEKEKLEKYMKNCK